MNQDELVALMQFRERLAKCEEELWAYRSAVAFLPESWQNIINDGVRDLLSAEHAGTSQRGSE